MSLSMGIIRFKYLKPRAFDQYSEEPKIFGEEEMNALIGKKSGVFSLNIENLDFHVFPCYFLC
jgi:hypothetical protein